MANVILSWGIWISQCFLALALAVSAARLILGPRAEDRIVALDAMYLCGILLLITFGIRVGNSLFFEAALVISLMGFVSSTAFAKFLMRGEVIE